MGLEVCDGGDGEVDVGSPAGDDRAAGSGDWVVQAGVSVGFKIGEERVADVGEAEGSFGGWGADEAVVDAGFVAAELLVWVEGPEVVATGGAFFPVVAVVVEERQVVLLGHGGLCHKIGDGE